ncbi:Hypothetical_protein [Hexamita inflata]|uniref:Hypothetical_protein n=1 Tax=Hexamita inflata TaxID=28002 RepID=A0AA86QBK9_9EUKA|nr:Hypothetical protein HINF_LOCUS40722 [Hexamita inflata]
MLYITTLFEHWCEMMKNIVYYLYHRILNIFTPIRYRTDLAFVGSPLPSQTRYVMLARYTVPLMNWAIFFAIKSRFPVATTSAHCLRNLNKISQPSMATFWFLMQYFVIFAPLFQLKP